jgi:purine nucleosidase/pyrimidine-specific ribonucleoside hydrolase
MLFALAPELFRLEDLRLSVSTGSTAEAGALTIEEKGMLVQVAMGVDGPAALDLLTAKLTAI